MSEDNSPLNHGQLVDALQNLCQQKKSGTILVATHDNSLARILLDGGRIVSIVFGQKRDSDAIAMIREITSCRVKFSDSVVGPHEGKNLPATSTILRMLGGGTNAPGGAGTTAIDAALGIIEHELIEVLGPMASLIWGEHLEKAGKPLTPATITRLLQTVATEISDPGKRQRFKEQVEKKLRG
jgi:hypothetical protein